MVPPYVTAKAHVLGLQGPIYESHDHQTLKNSLVIWLMLSWVGVTLVLLHNYLGATKLVLFGNRVWQDCRRLCVPHLRDKMEGKVLPHCDEESRSDESDERDALFLARDQVPGMGGTF